MKILKNNQLIEFDNHLYNDNQKISFTSGEKLNFSDNVKYIVPGFIDQHIHGADNCDVMDNSVESIKRIANKLLAEGTTSFCPTTMTYDIETLKEVIDNVYNFRNNNSGAKIIGMHLEGPFISSEYIGAQNPLYVRNPDVEILEQLNKDKFIKIVTYAPENDPEYIFTKYCVSNNIIASVGHSGASADVVNEAIKNGMSSFTHFHNACSPHHHRTPGVVTSGLMNKDVNVELICDGIHLHPTTVKATYDVKGYENINLVTDSMRAKGCINGVYDLGGQDVYKEGLEARLKNGVLAGSVLPMNVAVANIHKFTGCAIEEAFKMASYNVCMHLDIKDRGLISEGYACDILGLDEDLNVIDCYVDGQRKELK